MSFGKNWRSPCVGSPIPWTQCLFIYIFDPFHQHSVFSLHRCCVFYQFMPACVFSISRTLVRFALLLCAAAVEWRLTLELFIVSPVLCKVHFSGLWGVFGVYFWLIPWGLTAQILLSLNYLSFPDGPDGEESTSSVGDPGSTPGSRRSPGEGNGYPLQCSCLENSMDRGAWRAPVHRVIKNQTRLRDFHKLSVSVSCLLRAVRWRLTKG